MLSEFRTSLSKVLTLCHCVKVKQRYLCIFDKIGNSSSTISMIGGKPIDTVHSATPQKFNHILEAAWDLIYTFLSFVNLHMGRAQHWKRGRQENWVSCMYLPPNLGLLDIYWADDDGSCTFAMMRRSPPPTSSPLHVCSPAPGRALGRRLAYKIYLSA